MSQEAAKDLRWWIQHVIVPITVALIGGAFMIVVVLMQQRGPPQPATTPTDLTRTEVGPSSIPEGISPEQALREYYGLINERAYDVTWSMLTNHFKADKDLTRNEYVGFWNTVDQVRIVNIQADEVTATSAWLTADLTYDYFSGTTINESTKFNLVWDPVGQQWMITHTERLQP